MGPADPERWTRDVLQRLLRTGTGLRVGSHHAQWFKELTERPTIVAEIDWQAVGAVAGGFAAIVGVPLAFAAWVTARQAKRQAAAAEKMAKVAEATQTRATEPSLQIQRQHGGFAQVQINEPEQAVYVYIENLRSVVAELEVPYLNDQLGRVVIGRCDPEQQGIIEFPIQAIGAPGGDRARPHQLRLSVRVPESGRTGHFRATLVIQGGGWNAHAEKFGLSG